MQTQQLSRPGGTIAHDDQGSRHYPHAELPDENAPATVAFLDSLGHQSGPARSKSAVTHGD